jgi:hypothetical protein
MLEFKEIVVYISAVNLGSAVFWIAEISIVVRRSSIMTRRSPSPS